MVAKTVHNGAAECMRKDRASLTPLSLKHEHSVAGREDARVCTDLDMVDADGSAAVRAWLAQPAPTHVPPCIRMHLMSLYSEHPATAPLWEWLAQDATDAAILLLVRTRGRLWT